ncbi:hypothetical protein FA13DRAFT_1723718, partial [Coprinellus micaceus]
MANGNKMRSSQCCVARPTVWRIVRASQEACETRRSISRPSTIIKTRTSLHPCNNETVDRLANPHSASPCSPYLATHHPCSPFGSKRSQVQVTPGVPKLPQRSSINIGNRRGAVKNPQAQELVNLAPISLESNVAPRL